MAKTSGPFTVNPPPVNAPLAPTAENMLKYAKSQGVAMRPWYLVLDACENVILTEHIASPATREHLRILKEAATFFAAATKNATKAAAAREFRDMYWKAMRLAAKVDFDSFCIYLERNRPAPDRFYTNRREQLKEITTALMDMCLDKVDEGMLQMPARVGKALADDTPIFTSKGWKTHGDLKIGDTIFSPEGKEIRVNYVHPKCEMTHRVTMNDGSTFDCHFRHEWHVWNRKRGKWQLKETQDLIDEVEYFELGKTRPNLYLPLHEPLVMPQKNLPVDPYVLGAWLGDGTHCNPLISADSRDREVISEIVNRGYAIMTHRQTGIHASITTFKGLREDLNRLGLCKLHKKSIGKFFPSEYLLGSTQQRLDLLAGLLDTDGTLNRKERRYCFSTTNESLRDGVISLASSLGWRVSVSEYKPCVSSSGVHGRQKWYKVSFNPDFEIPCRVPRKQLKVFSKKRRISIKSIEPLETPVQGNCITVDGGMYLAGERMLPTHNTTLLAWFMLFASGVNPDRSNLYVAFSGEITKSFYRALLEVLQDPVTYCYHEIFPQAQIVRTDGDATTIDLNRSKHYPTITCRSLYGTLNGSCDCNGYLVADDLLSGAAEARSPTQLATAQFTVSNNMMRRLKNDAKLLWCGTPWSIRDPMGNRARMLKEKPEFANRRFKHIVRPALNEKGESNFDYANGVGFDTAYYEQVRAEFEFNDDLASWETQCQCNPVERHGLLFKTDQLITYNGILPCEPDRIVMTLDPAWGGGDYVAGPVAAICNGIGYVIGAVYTKLEKDESIPMVVTKVLEHQVTYLEIEANKMTRAYAEEVEVKIGEKGYPCAVATLPADNQTAKADRIMASAPDIRQLRYLDVDKRDKMYNAFMNAVLAYDPAAPSTTRHDDAPDSLAMLTRVVKGETGIQSVTVVKGMYG